MARLTGRLPRRAGALAAGALALVLPVPGAVGGGSGSRLGEECTPARTELTVRAFVSAFATRRLARVDALFAREPRFQWYSTTPPGARLGRQAYRRSTLASYFAARMRVRERLTIVRVNPLRGATADLGNVNGVLRRQATGLRPTRYRFKAAIYCGTGAEPVIFVWSMSRAAS